MEKHRCKLCYRRFSNGRALGGHMRSHMMNLPIPPKPETETPLPSSESDESSSSSDSEQEEGEIVKGKLLCKLRENPKKSIKLVDPEFSNVVTVDEAAGSSSVTLQDRESETESSRNPTRRRSKRTRKPASSIKAYHQEYNGQVHNLHRSILCDSANYYNNDVEPGSSVSDVTSEEDVAFCLMMLSRDQWSGNGHGHEFNSNIKEFTTDDGIAPMSQNRKKYQCDTCNKVFRSYQALGGHRASHKKLRVSVSETVNNSNKGDNEKSVEVVNEEENKKIHECPVCFRVFASGQALGGHKRSHVVGVGGNDNSVTPSFVPKKKKKKKMIITESLIDLNLPAPLDDDDDETSQIALSAVSDVHL